ncbi:MAG: FadR family transcriptional regulator, partial [Deltaproteobacteria bacterium]|nr:FadR family transcriptional regulator [Deltaproteobacteria bacterium]
MFRKAKQNRIFEDVVEQIQEAVLEGRLEPGSKLPSERDLREMFNTSRGTLREALRVLEQKGLISIKTGVTGGAVVNALTTSKVSESLDLLIRYQKVSLSDLAEFREGVEGIVAGLA